MNRKEIKRGVAFNIWGDGFILRIRQLNSIHFKNIDSIYRT